MYIIIAGGGVIGKGLAKRLIESKHDVVIIDIDQKACEEIYSKYGAVTVIGNATDMDTLESAKIDKCDTAVAVMRKDTDNLAFSILAKHFNVKQILARMNDPKYENVYKIAGVTNIARTTDILIDSIISDIESPEVRKVISLGDIEIDIINVQDNSNCINKNITSIVKQKDFPDNLIITAIYQDRNEMFIVPHGNTIINANDRIFLCGHKKDILKAAKIFKKSG
jgi:trk system potassium uptake protein